MLLTSVTISLLLNVKHAHVVGLTLKYMHINIVVINAVILLVMSTIRHFHKSWLSLVVLLYLINEIVSLVL